MNHLRSNHEEADIKIVMHQLLELQEFMYILLTLTFWFCSSADILNYAKTHLSQELARITDPGWCIYEALGSQKAAALPAFHALTGADVMVASPVMANNMLESVQ